MEDADRFLAQKLQAEFDREYVVDLTSVNAKNDNDRDNYLTKPSTENLSVIDPVWETTDPNPDVHALFLQYNDQYFWGRLQGVEVKWSPRMTLCAGVCSYEGRGGLCSIRLSVPLLKLRPRKDLVETLLHEMIHAFLFVTENDRDRDGHGPNFQKHMHRINKASGAKISIYHDFHDEVDNYRQHWWRCNGPCQNRRPYFGWVKRAMNRAPSPRDFWWEEHARTCGGAYTKVKEPEGYGVKKKGAKEQGADKKIEQKSPPMDIRAYLGKGNMLGASEDKKGTATGIKSTSTTGPDNRLNNTNSGTKHPRNGHLAETVTSSTIGSAASRNSETFDDPDFWLEDMWTDFDTVKSNSSSNKDLNVDPKPGQGAVGVGNKKTWTVVTTKKDEDVEVVSSEKGVSEQAKDTGQVLGTDSGGELNWLARMRKQWAILEHERTKSNKSKIETVEAEIRGENQDRQFSRLSDSISEDHMARARSEELEQSGCSGQAENSFVSLSDKSLHDSFHVSSCEEDNWPTPEKYYTQNGLSPPLQLKRKRRITVLSSDEDEGSSLPDISKRAKQSSGRWLSSVKKSPDISGGKSDKVNGSKQLSKEGAKSSISDDARNFTSEQLSKEDTKSSISDGARNFTEHSGFISNQYDESSVRRAKDQNNKHDVTVSKFTPHTKGVTSDTDAEISFGSGEEAVRVEDNVIGSSLVVCPSCQQKVPNETINEHLDMCLS